MKLRMIIIIGVILGSLAVLFFSTGSSVEGTVLLADVTDVLDRPQSYQDRELRVRGFIKPGTILRYGEKADFILTQDGRDIKVHFDGSTQLPDTFADGVPARADGRLKADGKLLSHKVEAKCASKYDAEYAEGTKKKPPHDELKYDG